MVPDCVRRHRWLPYHQSRVRELSQCLHFHFHHPQQHVLDLCKVLCPEAGISVLRLDDNRSTSASLRRSVQEDWQHVGIRVCPNRFTDVKRVFQVRKPKRRSFLRILRRERYLPREPKLSMRNRDPILAMQRWKWERFEKKNFAACPTAGLDVKLRPRHVCCPTCGHWVPLKEVFQPRDLLTHIELCSKRKSIVINVDQFFTNKS